LDDEPMIRRIMASVLEKAFNATVRGVATNDEAIQELETQRFDLIVTDLSHQGGNGLELLAALRKDARWRRIPILVQSAQVAGLKVEVEAWRRGARGVLAKPYSLRQFVEAAEALLGVTVDADNALIELGSETQSLDYKSTIPLTEKAARAALAKDVIAMANTGGGTIVVGVEESTPGSFVPSGMSESSCAPLETTRLNQALSAFVDPPMGIRSRQVLYNGKRFVFIEVPSAAPQLAMSRRDHPEAGLFVGRIYVRTTAAQSAPLQTSAEIRTLVERLARELVRVWKEEIPQA